MLIILPLSSYAFGPIAPTDELKPKVPPTKIINKPIPDLPYQPPKKEDEEDFLNSQNQTEDLSFEIEEEKPKKKKVDWEKLPFVPMKVPELKHVPDPEIE